MSTALAIAPEPRAVASQRPEPTPWLWIAILIVAAAAPYLPTLGYGFVFDDMPQIVNNHDLLSLRNIPRFFTQAIEKSTGLHGDLQPVFYRPLFFSQLCLTRLMFGPAPFGFHLLSLLFHIANTLLLYLTAIRLGVHRSAAQLAGVLFAVHPVHVETVVWPSATPDLMVFTAILGSIVVLLESEDASSPSARYRWLALSLTTFLASLLIKETGLVTLPLVAAIVFFNSSGESGTPDSHNPDSPSLDSTNINPLKAQALRRTMLTIAPYLGIALFYFAVRTHVVHGLVTVVTPTSWLDMAKTWPGVLWFYERHLLLPTHTSILYDYDLVEYTTLAAFWLPLSLVLASLTAVAFFLWRHRSTAAIVATLLLISPILMALNFRVFFWRDLVHDRYLYTPSAGFYLLVAMALCDLARRFATTIRPSIQRFLAASLACVLAITTVAEAQPWKNNLLLMLNAVQVAPGNIAAEMLLGTELENQNHPAEAAVCYARAVQLTPAWGPAWFAYGRALLLTHDSENAIGSLQLASRLDHLPAELVWLSLAMQSAGRAQEAESLLAQAATQDPSMAREYAQARKKMSAAPIH